MILGYLLLTALVIFYLVYSFRFSRTFVKSIYFTGAIKTFHLFMIWLVPFLWIFILKSVTKPTAGSNKFEDKSNPESSTECGLGIWIDQGTGT
jgi:hypothetical protein